MTQADAPLKVQKSIKMQKGHLRFDKNKRKRRPKMTTHYTNTFNAS